MWHHASTRYHDKSDGTFQRNRPGCGAVNRLQSPSHFLQEFPRHQGHTLLPGRVILGSSSHHLFTSFTFILKFSCQKAREVPGSFGSTLCSMWFHCMTDVFTHLSDPLLSKSSAMIIMVQNNCPTPAWSSGYCWTTLGTLVARRQAASLICPTVSPPHLPNHPSSSALLCCTQHTSSQHEFGSCTMN